MYKYILAFLMIMSVSAFGQLGELPAIGNVYDSATTFLDGMAYDKPSFSLINSSSASGIVLDIEKDGGGNIIFHLDGVESTLDCLTGGGAGGKARVDVTDGTDVNTPTTNYVYVTNSGGTATLLSSTSRPTGSFAWVGKVIIPDSATFNTSGAYSLQRFTESELNDSRGLFSHEREKLREVGAIYISGVAQSLSIGTDGSGPDTVHLATTAGQVYQLHRQTFPSFSVGPYYYGNGQNQYEQLDSDSGLSAAILTSSGASMANSRFNLILWGAINYDSATCKIFVNLPNNTYANNDQAIQDRDNTADYTVPADLRSTAFLIARLPIRHRTQSGGTWTPLGDSVYSLLGTPPGIRAGGSGGAVASNEFSDAEFLIFDNIDPTKIIDFQASSITTGNSRTITMADEDIDLGEMMRDVGDTVSGTYNFSGNPLEFIRMIDFDDTITTPAYSEGRVFYDKTDNTLCYYNNEADVTMNLGQEGWVYARNITGSTILDGKIVHITGAVSSRPTIALAQADAEATSKLIGVATHDIETASNGYVTVWGIVRGINLSDFSDGDEVFLSAAVAGSLTATAPSAPNYVVEVGYVIDASANGDLLVSTGKSKMLNSLGDILISGPTTGDILVYDGTVWADTNTLTAASPNFTGKMTADSAQFDGNVDIDSMDVNGATNLNGQTIVGISPSTSFQLQAINNPTTNDEGEIAWDSNDDAIEVFMGDEGESALIPGYRKFGGTISVPDSIQVQSDSLPIWHANGLMFPFGIEIDLVSITLEADAAYSVVLQEWSSADPPVYQNVITTIATGASDSYAEESPDTDGNLDINDRVYLVLPTTDVPSVMIEVYYHITEGN